MRNEESAQTLRALRKELGLTQAQFCHVFGKSLSTYEAWERAEKQPSIWLRKAAFLSMKDGTFGVSMSLALQAKYEHYFKQ